MTLNESGATVELGLHNLGAGFGESTTDAQGNVNGSSANLGFNTQTGAVTGAATYPTNGTTLGGDVALGPNQVGVNASLKTGRLRLAGGFQVTAGQTTTAQHSNDSTAAMLGQE